MRQSLACGVTSAITRTATACANAQKAYRIWSRSGTSLASGMRRWQLVLAIEPSAHILQCSSLFVYYRKKIKKIWKMFKKHHTNVKKTSTNIQKLWKLQKNIKKLWETSQTIKTLTKNPPNIKKLWQTPKKLWQTPKTVKTPQNIKIYNPTNIDTTRHFGSCLFLFFPCSCCPKVGTTTLDVGFWHNRVL